MAGFFALSLVQGFYMSKGLIYDVYKYVATPVTIRTIYSIPNRYPILGHYWQDVLVPSNSPNNLDQRLLGSREKDIYPNK